MLRLTLPPYPVWVASWAGRVVAIATQTGRTMGEGVVAVCGE